MATYSKGEVVAIVHQLEANGEIGQRIYSILQAAITKNYDQLLLALVDIEQEQITPLTTLAGTALQKLLVQVLAEQTSEHAKKL